MKATSVSEVLELFHTWGSEHYDEEVSQIDHAVQCAALARSDGAPDELVAAALLHDVGHLLELADAQHGPPREADRDLRHEARGARYLDALFPDVVILPIALHVRAKRYLCGADPGYRDGLSQGSRRSLALQGGPMIDHELVDFEAERGWQDAVRLRRWDDGGKVIGLEVTPVDDFEDLLVAVAASRS